MSAYPKVIIYTDGASRGNPGPGGYGAILQSGYKRKEISKGFRLTTNNRMELMAVIDSLRELNRPCEVTIYTDSQYVVNAVEKGWLFEWEKKGFKKTANADLWKQFLSLYRQHKVKFVWIRGHNGHPENERCDYLAVRAASSGHLFSDTGYEQPQ